MIIDRPLLAKARKGQASDEWHGRSLGFARKVTNCEALRYPSVARWIADHDHLLMTSWPAPEGSVVFWRGGQYGACAVMSHNELIGPDGILTRALVERGWEYEYAGWVDPGTLS
jgi:hypothetical protein